MVKTPSPSKIISNNDRSDDYLSDEVYYAAHPPASSECTLRFKSSTQTVVSGNTIVVHPKFGQNNLDKTDRSGDEKYYRDHPIASCLPTMRLFSATTRATSVVVYSVMESQASFKK